MDLHKLRGFYHVVMHSGFTAAARRLHLTQPSISLQVKSLEEELGLILLDRRSRRVLLTREGELVYELAQRIFEAEAELETRFLGKGATAPPRLVVATNQSIASHILPPKLAEFASLYPGAEITVLNMRTAEVVSGVVEGRIHLGLVLIVPAHQGLEARPILPYSMVLITPRGHPLGSRRRITLADIARHPLISYTKDVETRQLIDRPFRDQKLKLSIAMALGSTDLIIKYVSLGHGIAIIHNLNIDDANRANLQVRPLDRYFSRQFIHCVHRRGEALPPAIRAFMNLF